MQRGSPPIIQRFLCIPFAVKASTNSFKVSLISNGSKIKLLELRYINVTIRGKLRKNDPDNPDGVEFDMYNNMRIRIELYRYDDETIVKTYFAKDALPEIKQERENARRAFVLGINTAIPYGIVRVGDGYGTVTELLNAIKSYNVIEVCSNLYNKFEDVIIPENENIALIKSMLTECGALSSLMSGSGPSVFGVFEDADRAEACAIPFCRIPSIPTVPYTNPPALSPPPTTAITRNNR